MSEEKKIPDTPLENNFSHPTASGNSIEIGQKKDSWFDILKFALITAAIVLPIRYYIAQPFIVSGPSMLPNFKDSNYLLVDEISYRFKKPVRGEVLVFNRPEEGKYLIKRIIGLPGETITLDGDKITITNKSNPKGFTLNQSFLTYTASEPKKTVTLDSDHYFVLGDNRPVSYDSRYWGPLPKNQIVGRPFIRLYPFNALGFFPGDESATIGQ
jgi:signal peptidase I